MSTHRTTPATPIPYSDDVEQTQPDEAEHIARCIDAMHRTNEMTFDQHRHGYRATHAKSHGILRGTLEIHDDLPPELAQGLFATPGTHPVVVRIATETGQLDDDRAANARGFALKILDVPGEKMHPRAPDIPVQDFLFNTLPVLPPGTAKKFMELAEIRERYFHDLTGMDEAVGQRDDAEELTAFGRLANIHPLAHAYYTQAAFRYGDHVAKLAVYPGTAEQEALSERSVTDADPDHVLRDLLASWATDRETVFDVRVQLRTNADTMPVEDAAVYWPEDESPYRSVATVRLPPQDAYSPARRVFADDRLAFRPWNGLPAHRPLGSINRLRRRAYEVMGQQRFTLNATTGTEMTAVDELPE
ncbi:catalase family protein [Pseudonocardia sp. KRD291]|uniref:catalase family protein n=1 Tax=Pseudonocardia sp. KRD291 TaxID=2792007 RepID=UPI001C49EB78|nr:catalase family protein [Pseudonocardia sp. KRD291]MBW0103096.1 catalase family protein [Pseudonocardia sp. KRD291]